MGFKLQKLTVYAYADVKRTWKSSKKFEVMYNPTSLTMSHQNVFEDLQGINTFGRQARYSHARSESLQVDLVIDGTGVSDFALTRLLGFGSKSVTEQIDDFLALTFHMDGEIHQPKFLRLEWGDGVLKAFDCRLDHVDIKYTSFERSGAPLRAELTVVFISDVDEAKQASKTGKASPDLSHVRVVRSGDTLPLLCQEIYGTPAHYIRVARYNRLNSFRDLTPGQSLIFPPLET
jgi:hypothetical protein